jgi:hypothetical protein
VQPCKPTIWTNHLSSDGHERETRFLHFNARLPMVFLQETPSPLPSPSRLDLFVSRAGLCPDAAPVRLGMRRRLLGEKPSRHSPPPWGEAPPARSAAWGRSPAVPLRHLGSRPAGPRRRMGESAHRDGCTGYAPPALRDSF